VVREQGDVSASRPLYERALGIHERTLGPDHPKVAISLSNLGDLLLDLGDTAGAKAYFERSLAIREKALGPDHLDLASSLNSSRAGIGRRATPRGR
jgi:hypothetical protein